MAFCPLLRFLGIFNETFFNFFCDYFLLYKLWKLLKENSEGRAKLGQLIGGLGEDFRIFGGLKMRLEVFNDRREKIRVFQMEQNVKK